jgi:hypothetical protein
VDALLVTHLPDVRWLCGFTGSNAALVLVFRVAHGIYGLRARGAVYRWAVHGAGQG